MIVHDGKHHPVDSKEVAFVAAGKAFLDAIAKARPQVLEPVVDLEVAVPEAQVGDITGNLAGKRARINGTDTVRGEILVKAQVPLAELEGYAAEAKSMTAGRGRYSLDFSHYEPVPPAVRQVDGGLPATARRGLSGAAGCGVLSRCSAMDAAAGA